MDYQDLREMLDRSPGPARRHPGHHRHHHAGRRGRHPQRYGKSSWGNWAVGEHYIHADAALSGMILPHVDDPQPFGFDAGIGSISISGHKLIGAPLPCGIVLTRRHLVETLGRAVELVGVNDTTLSGSRNGLTPLMIWYAINRRGEDGWRETVRGMLDTADYAVEQFNEQGIKRLAAPQLPHRGVRPPRRGKFSSRWQIAPEGEVAHIITMPHVDRDMIDRLVRDCVSPRSGQQEDRDPSPADAVQPAQAQERAPADAATVPRIVVMAENQVGVIASIAGVLAQGGVNLNSISTENQGQQGLVIITTDRTDHALAILNEAGFKAVSDEAVLVQLPDRPGALASLAGELKDAGLNIRTFHIIDRREGYATAAVTTDDQTRAKTALAGRHTVI